MEVDTNYTEQEFKEKLEAFNRMLEISMDSAKGKIETYINEKGLLKTSRI